MTTKQNASVDQNCVIQSKAIITFKKNKVISVMLLKQEEIVQYVRDYFQRRINTLLVL